MSNKRTPRTTKRRPDPAGRPERGPASDPAARRILTAAASVFAEEGFAGARVDEIARRARINKAMLYYHFGDKSSLYASVILDVVHGAWATIAGSLEKCRGSEEKLRAVISGIAHAATSSPHYPRLILRELATGAANLPAPVLKEWAGVFQRVRSILETGRKEKRFRTVDPLMTHLCIISSIIVMAASEPVREKFRSAGIPGIPHGRFTNRISTHVAEIILNGIKKAAAKKTER